MPSFARLLLYALHWIYSILSFFHSLVQTFLKKAPRSLDADRRRIPRHLAVIFALPQKSRTPLVTGALVDSVERAVKWCRMAGIERLTVYDDEGILVNASQKIRDRVVIRCDSGADSDSEVEYPLTPPISRPLSPECPMTPEELGVVTIDLLEDRIPRPAKNNFVLTRRRPEKIVRPSCEKPLTVHLVNRESSKLAIAAAARSLVRTHRRNEVKNNSRYEPRDFNLSIEALDLILEGGQGLPAPDLVMLHQLDSVEYCQRTLELYGFPPWQIRLSEIFQCRYPDTPRGWLGWLRYSMKQHPSIVLFDELQFRDALDEYAGAEMRLGK